MRTEKEMLDLITSAARKDPRVRAAYLEGSRVKEDIPRDIFQDYDVVFVVEDTKPFREDKSWIDQFGERLYMQYPEDNVYYPSDPESCYGWLIQFADGNRLDLHVSKLDAVLSNLEIYKVLVDKDNCIPPLERTFGDIYWIKEPTAEQYRCTCNEFWWCLNNVAKGLWRKEVPYVMDMIHFHVRPMLTRLLEWKIGAENQFQVSAGKSAKYMGKYLPEEIYLKYLSTYSDAGIDEIWKAVFNMCDLFEVTAAEMSEKLDLPYDAEEARNAYGYLRHIRRLPADAEAVY